MEPNRLLALSACHDRLAYVFFIGHDLKDWRISRFAARSPVTASAFAEKYIHFLKPEVVVTEAFHGSSIKGDHTRALIAAMATVAEYEPVLDITMTRPRAFANKYDEAEALADRYPVIAKWKPARRRFFDNEPRNTVLFDALALADALIANRSD
jgi:hypothetical protein